MPIHLNLPPKGKRLIHDLTPFGLPEVPYFAAMNLPFTSPGLPAHTHRERMEISHILKGERVYRVGGKNHHLRGNQVFVTWPNEMHGSGTHLHGRGLHLWLQVALPKPGAPFLSFNAQRARPLLKALWEMPRRQFNAVPGMRELYVRMLDLCRKGPSELAGIQFTALLTEWFLLVADASTREPTEEITPDIARALDLIARVPYHHPTIDDLADAACLSESRFKGKFKEQLGVPPGEYLQRRRTEVAADLLTKGGKSLTEIALELGFSSTQHLSVAFKNIFGLSPLAWLKRQDDQGLGRQNMENNDHDGEPVRPWVDDSGLLHGYVYKSYRGNHP